MARRKSQGKPFDLDAMRALIEVETYVNSAGGKKKGFIKYSDFLALRNSERMKAMARALVSYHATKLTDVQVASRTALQGKVDERVQELADFRALDPAEAMKLKIFAGLDMAGFAKAYQHHVDTLEESIATLQGQIDLIDNARYAAGIQSYNVEMDLTTGNPADHPVNAGCVYLTPFATEKRDVYWVFETTDTWSLYEMVPAMGKAIKIWDTSLTEGDTSITSQTRLRKWAHAFVRGHQNDSGITALQNLAQGKVTWSEMGEGGIGRDGKLVQDVGDATQWVALHAVELETATDEATVEAA